MSEWTAATRAQCKLRFVGRPKCERAGSPPCANCIRDAAVRPCTDTEHHCAALAVAAFAIMAAVEQTPGLTRAMADQCNASRRASPTPRRRELARRGVFGDAM